MNPSITESTLLILDMKNTSVAVDGNIQNIADVQNQAVADLKSGMLHLQ